MSANRPGQTRDIQPVKPDAALFAGFTFATCGEAAKAETTASELGKNYPLDTLVQKLAIPQIDARIELQRGNSAKLSSNCGQLRPISSATSRVTHRYLRGLAYLQAKEGSPAVAEFQKLSIATRVRRSPYVSLTRLGLARSFVFLRPCEGSHRLSRLYTQWEGGDPDIPILKEAKAEYPK